MPYEPGGNWPWQDCAGDFRGQVPLNYDGAWGPSCSVPTLQARYMARSPIRQPSPETMETFEVLQLVFERLDHLEIPYFLAGSFASALHGIVRYTQDADLVADLQRTKVGEFHKTFEGDFYCDRGMIEQAVESGSSFNIIHVSSAFKIDIFLIGRDDFKREELRRRRLLPLDLAGTVEAFVQTTEDAL